ncbi:MAG: hypothetical protein AB7L66_05125 [Gemmatimonadales bacterium]
MLRSSPLARRFAQALGSRVEAILPPGFSVQVRDGVVIDVTSPGGESYHASAAASILDARDGRPVAELAECAARSILGGLQDAVAEALALPWPSTPQGQMALPDALVDAGTLTLWFGDQDAPLLALRPLRLADLQS